MVFDVNDFDETLEAPFEWDVKRLGTSLVVAGRDRGFSAASVAPRHKQRWPRTAGGWPPLRGWAIWRCGTHGWTPTSSSSCPSAPPTGSSTSDVLRRAERATNLGALNKLTDVVDGQRRIIDSPPLIEHLPHPGGVDAAAVVAEYAASLSDATRTLLARYRVVDWARKVVGVGSVGTDDAPRPAAGRLRQRPAVPPGQRGQRIGTRAVRGREPL